MHYAYILRSLSDADKLYYGSTADLKKRFATHNAGGNISTKPFRPWEIAWYAGFPNQKQLVISRSISKRHLARHLPKSVYSMPMNHDSFIWVGVMAF
jgi:predicted GIY-YIG superfamily endonuclease